MRSFKYEARDVATNKIEKSTVQADSEKAAGRLLIDQGFVPIKIEEINENGSFLSKLTGRITTKDKVVFTRQLATLIGAGLPLSQSLRTVVEQTENKKLQQTLQQVIGDVESGKQLSQAFAKHPEVFNKVFVALVAAGETSGTLDDSLRRLAAQQEKDAAMMSKIRGAMVYPAIVLFVIGGVMAFMLIAVVPQVEQLYKDMNKELPWLTAMMVSMANFLVRFWWLILIVLGFAIYFFKQYLKTEAGIKTSALFKLNVPLFSGMFRRLYMARFTRTGQTLLASGVAMLDMLRISADAVNNVVVAEEITRAADKVKGGKALSSALEKEEYMLVMVPQMVKIGEQSGKIDEMMGKTAQIYEDELDEQIKAISTAIEPILMVVLAIVAGGMVGAILFPIYSLVNGVG